MNYVAIPGIKSVYRADCAPRFSKEAVLSVICSHFNITRESIVRKNRKREVVFPRQLAMFLLYQYTTMTYKQIGKEFSRDHTTVINSKKVIGGLMDVEPKIKLEVAMLIDEIIQWHR